MFLELFGALIHPMPKARKHLPVERIEILHPSDHRFSWNVIQEIVGMYFELAIHVNIATGKRRVNVVYSGREPDCLVMAGLKAALQPLGMGFSRADFVTELKKDEKGEGQIRPAPTNRPPGSGGLRRRSPQGSTVSPA